MKKRTLFITTIILICACAFALVACSSSPTNSIDDTSKVDTISIAHGGITVNLSGAEAQTLAAKLSVSLTKDEKQVTFSTVSTTSDYVITVTTVKTFLKKADTYTISVGRTTKVTTAILKNENETYDKYYLSRNGYHGTVTDATLSTLAALFV